MKRKKWLGLLFISAFIGFSGQDAFAAPVEPRGVEELRQATGETFRAEVRGDEHLFYGVVEGTQELVMYGKSNNWYYAVKDSKTKQLVPSTKKYNVDPKPKNAAYEKDLASVTVPVTEVTTTKSPILSRSVKQNRNMLVVMIEFSDTPSDYSEKDWYNRVFAANQESVNDYYNEATKGMIQFRPVTTAQKSGVDGVVKIKLNKKHPDSGFLTTNEKFTLPRQMINEALNQEKEFLNLKQYDRNNDGVVSVDELHVVVVFSGYSASDTSPGSGISPTIWPHKWEGVSVDGLKIGSYTAVTDKTRGSLTEKDRQTTIGTVVHELGHDLGLPDLYNPPGTYGAGLGHYSVMAMGSRATMNGKSSGSYPVHFDAYSKVKLGLVEPIVINKEQTITINELQQTDFNIAKVETDDPKQYYLIENRQMEGFDRALNSHVYSGGIGIYYVNEHIEFNDGIGKQIVTLREADEGVVGYSKLDNGHRRRLDGFYYQGIGVHDVLQPTELRKDTVPSSLLEGGLSPKFDIIVNDPSSDKMSVTFKSTEKTEMPTVPSGLKAVSTTANSIDLQWNASLHADGIKEYQIFRDGKQIATTATTRYTDKNLSSDTAYTYYVKAVGKNGEISEASNELKIRTQKAGRPPAPSGLGLMGLTTNSLYFKWSASSYDQGIKEYQIFRDDKLVATTQKTDYIDSNLTSDTAYKYYIKAVGNDGKISDASNVLNARTKKSKEEVPTVPTSLRTTASTTNSIDLQWNASSHTQGIKEYQIYRDGKLVGKTTSTHYTDTKLSSDTAYTYYVKAVSKTGEVSAASTTLSAKTQKAETHPEGIKEWDANTVYIKGDKVVYKGAVYTAKWWTRGNQPDTSDAWETSATPEWSSTKAYNGGDKVVYKGKTYTAKWWTRGEQPDKAGVWASN